MGGSIATKTAAEIFKNESSYAELYARICGLFIIDVVEGTALDALPFMESIVKNRPKSFGSQEEAIQYMLSSNTIRDRHSAKLSVPSLVQYSQETGRFHWVTDLLSTKPYWKEWFTGLTNCFLSIRVPKLLLLAGSERMDKDLTVAQMQGKFKMGLIRNVGHLVHEDDPKGAAKQLKDYIETFRIAEYSADNKLPNLKAWGGKPIKLEKYVEFAKN